ncbi:hypothetical protein [Rhodopirellula baltica]|uniref:Uncharacterized protein n=1 Tax=Rhodopirellula baltica SWK14 TaxID=993516 RepID=L7C866_RHOBT|nr:hypothetical protein [Rhodopirellula baltica]ELP30233.1 hypothetical protein RBSWK_05831 [Rhodopirellula baltica SWK14]
MTDEANNGSVRFMDPETTLSDLFDALATGDRGQAVEHAANLRQWLSQGGFLPSLELKIGTRTPQPLPHQATRLLIETTANLTSNQPAHAINPGRDPQHG